MWNCVHHLLFSVDSCIFRLDNFPQRITKHKFKLIKKLIVLRFRYCFWEEQTERPRLRIKKIELFFHYCLIVLFFGLTFFKVYLFFFVSSVRLWDKCDAIVGHFCEEDFESNSKKFSSYVFRHLSRIHFFMGVNMQTTLWTSESSSTVLKLPLRKVSLTLRSGKQKIYKWINRKKGVKIEAQRSFAADTNYLCLLCLFCGI